MPTFDSITRTKIETLRTMYLAGEGLEVHELVKIDWPSPDGTIYYCAADLATVSSAVPPSVTPIEVRLVPDSSPNHFLPVSVDASIGDEEVDLKFWDADEVMSQLLVDHGESIPVTLYYLFPQVELMLAIWNGHLRFEDEAAVDILPLKAANGFRSAEANIPHRAHYQECQRVFGGILDNQAAIDEHGCPYNKHLGGSIGTDDPATSAPWTFCDRASTASCTARGVNPLRHLSHNTIISVVINNQTKGPNLYSTSGGNESNLKNAVRVVAGKIRVYNCPIMAFRRDLNSNTPAHGFFQGFYEIGEGPVKSISGVEVTVGGTTQSADPFHLGYRLGLIEQPSADGNLTTHGYSNTAYIRYAFGWVDPSGVEPGDATASALVEGNTEVYQQADVAAGSGGLKGTWHRRLAFDDPVGVWLFSAVDVTDQTVTAPALINSAVGFGIRMTGQIKPRYSETYTFTTPVNDDIVTLTINGTVVINDATYPATGSGTIALTADTLYDITVDLTNIAAEGYNPWGVQLKWQSASQALEVVPASRLYHDAFLAENWQYTQNRAWWIMKLMTDKRFGFGYDIARFNMDMWKAAAIWCDKVVRYTDPNGVTYDHVRAEANFVIDEKKAQQQIEDLCIAGRLSRPFLFDGKICIVPLSAATADELAAAPVFTDEGPNRNVIHEKDGDTWRSTLKVSRTSDIDLVNRVETTYNAIDNAYIETPAQPVEDIDAQLAAGRVVGDNSRKVNSKKYPLLGTVYKGQQVKTAWSLLDLGPCDDGGLRNNLKLKFRIWFADAMDLHVEKIIKVESTRLVKYGFDYFRVKKLKRLDNLEYEIEVQAYNKTYMDTFEVETIEGGPIDPPPIDPPPIDPPVCVLNVAAPTYNDGTLVLPIEAC